MSIPNKKEVTEVFLLNPGLYPCTAALYSTATINPQYSLPETNQDQAVQKAIKAIHELCDAVKQMDEPHRREAMCACAAVMISEMYN